MKANQGFGVIYLSPRKTLPKVRFQTTSQALHCLEAFMLKRSFVKQMSGRPTSVLDVYDVKTPE